eukprot:TRINITY_DN61463_c0_g1_i1.p1 TRINITY_DN61463_c0_g1~~TRINITY_DN61463_c0_g1_i1.p1  ORF type:complete len:736 (+),score=94.46 TRINITY_DN61463_c0_g1_i1:21-2228(+)
MEQQSAAQRLQQVVAATAMGGSELHLGDMGIEDLAPLIPLVFRQLPNLRILRLPNNRLRYLPTDLSCFKDLVYLDISGNNFKDLSCVLPALQPLRSLKHLCINLEKERDEEIIIETLLSLETFNGTALNESTSDTMLAETSEINESTQWMEDAQNLVTAAVGRTAVSSEFQNFARGVITTLTETLSSAQDPSAREAEMLNSKALMFGYCFHAIARSCEPSLSSVLTTLYNTYNDILQKQKNIMREVMEDRDSKLSIMREDMQAAIREIEQLVDTFEKTKDLEKEKAQWEKDRTEWEKEKTGLVEEIGWLRHDNERIQAKYKQAELCKEKLLTTVTHLEAAVQQQEQYTGQTRPPRTSSSTSVAEIASNNRQSSYYVEGVHTQPQHASSSSSNYKHQTTHTTNNVPHTGRTTPTTQTCTDTVSTWSCSASTVTCSSSATNLTQSTWQQPKLAQSQGTKSHAPQHWDLHQLKSFIEELYNSKTLYDAKCSEKCAPRETLEQYLSTYLRKKYSNADQALSCAQAVTMAMYTYSGEDNDVAVFEKIIKNELDDEFRLVQQQLKKQVHDLYLKILQARQQHSPSHRPPEFVEPTQCMHEGEWREIVCFLYEANDANTLCGTVKQLILNQRKNATPNEILETQGLGLTIKYNNFLKVLLDFQLKNKCNFLEKFISQFQQFDKDHNGTLNEKEFIGLVDVVCSPKKPDKAHKLQLLAVIDPYKHHSITFSQCVTLFSSEKML